MLSTTISTIIPDWPQERDLAKYAEFTQLNFDRLLMDNMRWMDVGCRTGLRSNKL